MKKVVVTILVVFLCFFASAQEIASFSSLNNTGCSGVVYNDANVIANGICRGSGISIKTGAGTYDSLNWTNSTSIDANDYIEWSISPNTGYLIDLSSMQIAYDRSNNGPTVIEIQMDYGFGYTTVFNDTAVSDTGETVVVDLSTYLGIGNTITFRLYGYGASSGAGTFDIEQYAATNKGIIVNGTVSSACATSTTWNGSSWSFGNPDITQAVVIAGDYSTIAEGSFSACRLIISAGTLTINDGDYVEVQNDLINNSNLIIKEAASFLQVDDAATVSGSGSTIVEKRTAKANNWYEYTYWSSPVSDANIANGLTDAQTGRIYLFNAQNYLDELAESNNNNTYNVGQDGVDDDGNDWQKISMATAMTPGVGYASMHNKVIFESSPGSPKRFLYTFEGTLNNGVVTVPVYRNDSEANDTNWNFIGNPYASAIDANAFLTNNPDLGGTLYYWSQNTAPSASNNGNQYYNFSNADYAYYNVGVGGGTAGGDGVIPSGYIPSCQGFFVEFVNTGAVVSVSGDVKQGTATFDNTLRTKGTLDNTQFFKSANGKTPKQSSEAKANKMWLNLTSDNGVSSQILIGYVDGATADYDGSAYDTEKIVTKQMAAGIYATIKKSDKKFVIQGKHTTDLDRNEKMEIGFLTKIDVPTIYKIAVAQKEGDFLNQNTIYLKDKLLKKTHDLSASNYSFTSEVGDFKDRFEIVFKSNPSSDILDSKNVAMATLGNDHFMFTTENQFQINAISIYDILGNQIYNLKSKDGNNGVYHLSKLTNTTLYIAKIELADGNFVTKKFVKHQ